MTRPPHPPVFAPLGDAAILVTLGSSVDRETIRRVHACVAGVRDAALSGVLDVVPAYSSFAVHFDAHAADAAAIAERLPDIVKAFIQAEPEESAGTVVTIPVRYDGADLPAVAGATGLTIEEVIERHLAAEYFVYMLGFAPGFAYLGDLDPTLRLPRLKVPRTSVPRGAVAIAGAQTAVYPHETPGGWHLIGSTVLAMFDPTRDPPALLHAGHRVRFERVT
ncbi:MAG: 5-oxoprolinase subunit PxpB [Gemmatimonadaceae bacterium]